MPRHIEDEPACRGGRRSGRPAPGRAAPSPTARERVSRCRPRSSHLHLLAAIYLVPTVLALRNLFKNRWPGPGRRLVPFVSSMKGTAQWGEESRDLWGRHVRPHARIPNTAHGSVDALCGPRTPAEAFPTAHTVCLPVCLRQESTRSSRSGTPQKTCVLPKTQAAVAPTRPSSDVAPHVCS